jgi:hypothetical protein
MFLLLALPVFSQHPEWVNYNTSNSSYMSFNSVRSNVIDESNNMWIGTGGGLAVFNEVCVVSEIENNPLSTGYLLYQYYPNPFNPITTISYSLPRTSMVSLKVYDILGKEVAALVNEEKPAGIYEIEFDWSNLSSGIYLYKLSASGRAGYFSETKKLILLK